MYCKDSIFFDPTHIYRIHFLAMSWKKFHGKRVASCDLSSTVNRVNRSLGNFVSYFLLLISFSEHVDNDEKFACGPILYLFILRKNVQKMPTVKKQWNLYNWRFVYSPCIYWLDCETLYTIFCWENYDPVSVLVTDVVINL